MEGGNDLWDVLLGDRVIMWSTSCKNIESLAGSENRGSGFILPRRGISPGILPTIDAGLNARDAIEGGPNVKAEHGASVGERRGGVVVDNISDFLARLWAVDDPVVSIEWWLGTV